MKLSGWTRLWIEVCWSGVLNLLRRAIYPDRMKDLIALIVVALLAALPGAFAQAPPLPPVIAVKENLAATSVATAYEQHVLDLNTLTVNPPAASLADFRADRAIVQIVTDANVAKADALSGYLYHEGAGELAAGYGGSLQVFLRDNGTCLWCEGGMAASRNRGSGRIENSIGLLATSENQRPGPGVGITNSYGLWGMVENYGRVESGTAGHFALRNFAGGRYDRAAGAVISIENESAIGQLDGLRIETTNNGAIDNYRVLYLAAPYGVTPQNAIVSAVPAPSVLAGDIHIGDRAGLQAQIDALNAQIVMLTAQLAASQRR